MSSTPTGSGLTALLFGIAALVVSAVVPLAVAFIGRGAKSKSVALDPAVAIPRIEYDHLAETVADQDDDLHAKDRELRHLREELSLWMGRAYRAGWKDET